MVHWGYLGYRIFYSYVEFYVEKVESRRLPRLPSPEKS